MSAAGTIDWLDQAREERNLAMARVAESAGDAWADQAYRFVVHYVTRLVTHSERFTATDVRMAAPFELQVREPRAWGPVIKRAIVAGMVADAGYVPNCNPKAHCRPTRAYRSLV